MSVGKLVALPVLRNDVVIPTAPPLWVVGDVYEPPSDEGRLRALLRAHADESSVRDALKVYLKTCEKQARTFTVGDAWVFSDVLSAVLRAGYARCLRMCIGGCVSVIKKTTQPMPSALYECLGDVFVCENQPQKALKWFERCLQVRLHQSEGTRLLCEKMAALCDATYVATGWVRYAERARALYADAYVGASDHDKRRLEAHMRVFKGVCKCSFAQALDALSDALRAQRASEVERAVGVCLASFEPAGRERLYRVMQSAVEKGYAAQVWPVCEELRRLGAGAPLSLEHRVWEAAAVLQSGRMDVLSWDETALLLDEVRHDDLSLGVRDYKVLHVETMKYPHLKAQAEFLQEYASAAQLLTREGPLPRRLPPMAEVVLRGPALRW